MLRKKLNLELYQKVYLIRMAEEKIREHYHENDMKTPTHLSIGEEAVVAGVCQALGKTDQLFGTYRGHGLYLARTGETDLFFAELFGKQTGLASGKTGSMHLHSIENGYLGSSAVVATTIPVAVGASYANKYQGNGKTVVSFFGDGALEEGAFWESLNAACVMKLPILFVCEDNELAIHSFSKTRQGFASITDIVSKFDCHSLYENSTDPECIYHLTQTALDRIQTTSKPCFMHVKYYRYYEHVGIQTDFQYEYRNEDEFKKWFEKDPVRLQRRKLIDLCCSEEEIAGMETEIMDQINRSFYRAKESPFPTAQDLYNDVYKT
ncbi:MAG: thiamine pyrophosphate-dependent dehydrogenase E1 component subunit alpha [Deltaproteobacteria bacterium]|nr:thiamine pyrophosphate-dependent dehydrogenase E1 component subunit alpha [Deltaproteobacteria bacterium]